MKEPHNKLSDMSEYLGVVVAHKHAHTGVTLSHEKLYGTVVSECIYLSGETRLEILWDGKMETSWHYPGEVLLPSEDGYGKCIR